MKTFSCNYLVNNITYVNTPAPTACQLKYRYLFTLGEQMVELPL